MFKDFNFKLIVIDAMPY